MTNIREGLKEAYELFKPFPDQLSKDAKQRVEKKLKFVVGSVAAIVSTSFMAFILLVNKEFRQGWSELR